MGSKRAPIGLFRADSGCQRILGGLGREAQCRFDISTEGNMLN